MSLYETNAVDTLPFGCRYEVVSSPDQVCALSLSSKRAHRISWTELEPIEFVEPDVADERQEFVLTVYARALVAE